MKNSSFDLSPDEIRRLGYAATDAVADARARLTSRPVFGKVGADAALFDEPAPEEGQPIEQTLAFVREHILPFPMGNSHPRFFGFINATADPVGIAADYLAASMNPNCWGGDHAAIHAEHRVMRWLADLLGYPGTSEGILVSGGSMANFTALAAARRAMTPGNVREDGLAGEGRPRVAVHASGPGPPDGLCLGPGPSLRGQGGRPPRDWNAAASQDRDRRALPHPDGPPRGGRRGGPPGGIDAGDRRRPRGGGQHGGDRSPGRDRGLLPPRVSLVSRGRGVRSDGTALCEARSPLLRDGARAFHRRGPQ